MNTAAVLGAGIMGGGIAFQSAVRGIPILMMDIRQDALDTGMKEAKKLLSKEVQRGQLNELQATEVGDRISPPLEYGEFSKVDLLVEAVVEKLQIKVAVLADVGR